MVHKAIMHNLAVFNLTFYLLSVMFHSKSDDIIELSWQSYQSEQITRLCL